MIGIPEDLLQAGSAEAVGYQYIAATNEHPPMRAFYPATLPQDKREKPIRWFQEVEGGVRPFLLGYMHTALVRHDTKAFKFLIRPLVYFLTLVAPMSWLRIPGVYEAASFCPAGSSKIPAIVFSHGLTGTGQENFSLCASWAKRGFLVLCLHHTDGSACHVRLADGGEKYYVHGPSMSSYDPKFRINQVKVRAEEVLSACQYLEGDGKNTEDNSIMNTIRNAVDTNQIIVAGYSYGAATAARAIAMVPERFSAAIFLDGWFHIDVSQSAGIQFEFPQEAFQEKDNPMPHLPSIFLNSKQFQGYSKLFQATGNLAERMTGKKEIHVLPESGHQNFCDVVFWAHSFALQKVMKSVVGKADPKETYKQIIDLTSSFLKTVVK